MARVQRYNRILERRIANHAVCREHELIKEFFIIAKTNVVERGKYAVPSGDLFPSRKRAEEVRPFLAKLRRVLDREELLELTEDIAEIETLMGRVKALRQLQTSGASEVKGRLKHETPRRRKRTKKSEVDIRK